MEGFVSFKENFFYPKKENPPTLYTHSRSYMVDGYEMGSYEQPLMSLRYSLICTLTTIH